MLSLDGIGTLELGAPASRSDLVEYNPDHCDLIEVEPALPLIGEWEWKARGTGGYPLVGLYTSKDLVQAIELRNESIATDRGVRVGDPVSPDQNDRVFSVVDAIDPPESYFSPRTGSNDIVGGCL